MADHYTTRGRAVLCIVQCAIMLDLVAVPLWVGRVLMGHYGFDPQQGGAMVSLYVAGVVISGLVTGTQLHRRGVSRWLVLASLAGGSLCFATLSSLTGYLEMAVLHFIAGLIIGPAYAANPGVIARSGTPHRLMAMASFSLGVLTALFLAVMPWPIDRFGGSFFFQTIAVIMSVALLLAIAAYPRPQADSREQAQVAQVPVTPIPGAAWACNAGLYFLCVNFSVTMSFLERVGHARGYGAGAIAAVLSAMAIVKLFPAAVAGLLEHRLQPAIPLYGMPLLQVACTAIIFAVPALPAYAAGSLAFIGTLTFAHIFSFGLLAKIDSSGRSNAMSASFMAMGTATGPFLGGSIVKYAGYPYLGISAAIISLMAIMAFARVFRTVAPSPALASG